MNVIKKGDKPYLYYRICEECGSIIEFKKADIEMGGRITCPICKNRIEVGYPSVLGPNILEKEKAKVLAALKEQEDLEIGGVKELIKDIEART